MSKLSRKSQPEPASLDQVVDSLPRQVTDWTPEQHAAYSAASNRAMREEAEQQTRK
ncbi:hypothetical protein ACF07F_16515 [Streptomyces sp. NPDC015237]|uniref:hypothetical protein n=1 Tax=Streptomyces sp. NPDC015237 TaxID=3364949 RepID=UPI00370150D0